MILIFVYIFSFAFAVNNRRIDLTNDDCDKVVAEGESPTQKPCAEQQGDVDCQLVCVCFVSLRVHIAFFVCLFFVWIIVFFVCVWIIFL